MNLKRCTDVFFTHKSSIPVLGMLASCLWCCEYLLSAEHPPQPRPTHSPLPGLWSCCTEDSGRTALRVCSCRWWNRPRLCSVRKKLLSAWLKVAIGHFTTWFLHSKSPQPDWRTFTFHHHLTLAQTLVN